MHRTGSYGEATEEGKYKHERRCMNESDMLKKGMIKNEKDIWLTGEFDASVFGKKEGKKEG